MPSPKMDDHQRLLDPATATGPTEADTRPGCATTTGAPSPQPFLDRLTATIERLGATRSIQRQLIALADEAPTITNEQLADRLAALANRLRALP
jgi:hypothetical protein